MSIERILKKAKVDPNLLPHSACQCIVQKERTAILGMTVIHKETLDHAPVYTSGTQKCKGAAAYFQSSPMLTNQIPYNKNKEGSCVVLSAMFSRILILVSPVCQ